MIDKVVFIGSKHLGLSTLKQLVAINSECLKGVLTIDDSADVRCKLNEFRELCYENSVPLHVLKKPSEVESAIKELSPEMILVVGWYWILDKHLLTMVPKGILGLHASLLPAYRGSAPLVWPIINDEKQSGVTLFYFDEGMDTGDIVAQESFDIGGDDSIAEVIDYAENAIFKIIEKQYPMLLNEKADRYPQSSDGVSYGAVRRPEDGEIYWNKSAYRIHNEIRAQTRPYPGAFTTLEDGRRIRVWSSRLFKYPYYGCPGTVVGLDEQGALVTCGDGAVYLVGLEIEDEENLNAFKFLKYGMKLGKKQ